MAAISSAAPADAPVDAFDAPLSPGRLFVRRFRRHRLGVFGLAVLALLVALTLLAPLLAPWGAGRSDYGAIGAGPSLSHPLGTDTAGRDVWARLLFGGRVCLSVGIIAVAISTVDRDAGRRASPATAAAGSTRPACGFTDIVMLDPGPVPDPDRRARWSGPSIYNVMVVIGLLGWQGLARLVRGQVLSLREQEYVLAALRARRAVVADHLPAPAAGGRAVHRRLGDASAWPAP